MTAETSNARGEWVLVPRELTEAMMEAASIGPMNYTAMLAAAPRPPCDMDDLCIQCPEAAPQPPAEAQPVAWVRWHAEHGFRWRPIEHEARSSDVHGYVSVPLYTAPPSAPVGVDSIEANDSADYIELCASRLESFGKRVMAETLRAIAAEHRALAQQPAAVVVDDTRGRAK